MRFSILLISTLFTLIIHGQDSQEKAMVGINSVLSYKMMDPVNDLRKVNILMDARINGLLESKSLNLGASIISLLDYQKSNTDSKFGYLMRHPTSSNQLGKTVTEAVIHSFQMAVTGSLNSWLATYGELLYDPQQSFGQGTITTLSRNQIQLRKGFILIGRTDKFPIYGSLGKMDTPFGRTGSVDPFTNSSLWHAFAGLGYGAQIGLKTGGLNIQIMAVQGGSQFRALNTPVADSTNVPSQLNNFVADLNYSLVTEHVKILTGASYMKGSSYCHEYPVMHFEPCKENNPAYTIYGNINIDDHLTLKGSVARTLNEWPGTHNPEEPLNQFPASKVSSMDAGIQYIFNPKGKISYALSGEFSNFRAGPEGSPWERQNQLVIGFCGMIQHSSKLFLELIRTDGYVPLNFISGGNMAPGETHSSHDANSHIVIVGGQITI